MGWLIWDKKENNSGWLKKFFYFVLWWKKWGEKEGLGWVSSLFFFFGDIVSQWVTRN